MQTRINDMFRRLGEVEGRVDGHDGEFDRVYMELGHDDPWA